MGTDGLWDNLFVEDMKPCLIKDHDLTKQASCIGEKAYVRSKDKRYESPFALGA